MNKMAIFQLSGRLTIPQFKKFDYYDQLSAKGYRAFIQCITAAGEDPGSYYSLQFRNRGLHFYYLDGKTLIPESPHTYYVADRLTAENFARSSALLWVAPGVELSQDTRGSSGSDTVGVQRLVQQILNDQATPVYHPIIALLRDSSELLSRVCGLERPHVGPKIFFHGCQLQRVRYGNWARGHAFYVALQAFHKVAQCNDASITNTQYPITDLFTNYKLNNKFRLSLVAHAIYQSREPEGHEVVVMIVKNQFNQCCTLEGLVQKQLLAQEYIYPGKYVQTLFEEYSSCLLNQVEVYAVYGLRAGCYNNAFLEAAVEFVLGNQGFADLQWQNDFASELQSCFQISGGGGVSQFDKGDSAAGQPQFEQKVAQLCLTNQDLDNVLIEILADMGRINLFKADMAVMLRLLCTMLVNDGLYMYQHKQIAALMQEHEHIWRLIRELSLMNGIQLLYNHKDLINMLIQLFTVGMEQIQGPQPVVDCPNIVGVVTEEYNICNANNKVLSNMQACNVLPSQDDMKNIYGTCWRVSNVVSIGLETEKIGRAAEQSEAEEIEAILEQDDEVQVVKFRRSMVDKQPIKQSGVGCNIITTDQLNYAVTVDIEKQNAHHRLINGAIDELGLRSQHFLGVLTVSIYCRLFNREYLLFASDNACYIERELLRAIVDGTDERREQIEWFNGCFTASIDQCLKQLAFQFTQRGHSCLLFERLAAEVKLGSQVYDVQEGGILSFLTRLKHRGMYIYYNGRIARFEQGGYLVRHDNGSGTVTTTQGRTFVSAEQLDSALRSNNDLKKQIFHFKLTRLGCRADYCVYFVVPRRRPGISSPSLSEVDYSREINADRQSDMARMETCKRASDDYTREQLVVVFCDNETCRIKHFYQAASLFGLDGDNVLWRDALDRKVNYQHCCVYGNTYDGYIPQSYKELKQLQADYEASRIAFEYVDGSTEPVKQEDVAASSGIVILSQLTEKQLRELSQAQLACHQLQVEWQVDLQQLLQAAICPLNRFQLVSHMPVVQPQPEPRQQRYNEGRYSIIFGQVEYWASTTVAEQLNLQHQAKNEELKEQAAQRQKSMEMAERQRIVASKLSMDISDRAEDDFWECYHCIYDIIKHIDPEEDCSAVFNSLYNGWLTKRQQAKQLLPAKLGPTVARRRSETTPYTAMVTTNREQFLWLTSCCHAVSALLVKAGRMEKWAKAEERIMTSLLRGDPPGMGMNDYKDMLASAGARAGAEDASGHRYTYEVIDEDTFQIKESVRLAFSVTQAEIDEMKRAVGTTDR